MTITEAKPATIEVPGVGLLTQENVCHVSGWLAPDGKLWWFEGEWQHHKYAAALVEKFYPDVFASHPNKGAIDWKDYLACDRGWLTVWRGGTVCRYGRYNITEAQGNTILDLMIARDKEYTGSQYVHRMSNDLKHLVESDEPFFD